MMPFVVLTILLVLPWLRIARPGGGATVGRIIHTHRLPLLARIRMHLVPAVLVLASVIAMQAIWTLPWWGALAALVDTALLIAVPLSYTLTSLGIRVGRTGFRRWTEFAGVSRAPGGAWLQGAAGARDQRIWLSGSRGDDEFVALLRRMIRSAYKGQNVLQEFPPRPSADRPGSSAASSAVSGRAV